MKTILSVCRDLIDRDSRISTQFLATAGAVLLSLGLVSVAAARQTHTVAQKNRAFVVKELAIAAGDVVEFRNEDEFIHQIFVKSSNFNFDSEESYPGSKIDVTFSTVGVFEVQCHIHPKKRMTVSVR